MNQNNKTKWGGPTYFKLHCFTTSKNFLVLMNPAGIFCEACSMTHSRTDSLHTESDVTKFEPAATSLSNYEHFGSSCILRGRFQGSNLKYMAMYVFACITLVIKTLWRNTFIALFNMLYWYSTFLIFFDWQEQAVHWVYLFEGIKTCGWESQRPLLHTSNERKLGLL